MELPALDWQFFYGRAAWAIVLATLVTALLPAAWRRSRRPAGGVLLAAAALMALPGEASPAYWLVLAFQWPSGILLGCCVLKLSSARPGAPAVTALPATLAAVIAAAGLVLYLDAFGLLSLGLYYWGFSPYAAPAVALLAAAGCALAAVFGRARPHALLALGALAQYSILRLPTGNLWDALLDPMLWGWALVALGVKSVRWLALKARAARQAAETEPHIATARAAGIERF